MANEIVSSNKNFLDKDWNEIVDNIVDGLSDDLPDKVIQATEYLLAGWPTYKVAKELRTSTSVIKGWLEKYPSMAVAVANGRKLLQKWRMSKLEQQFALALNKSEEILNIDLKSTEYSSKLVAAIGLQSRYVIGLFAGQQVDVNVNMSDNSPLLKAKADALDYLAGRMSQLSNNTSEVIEATYQIVGDPKELNVPMLDPEGNPPFGELGILDTNEDGSICHMCGKRFKNLNTHVSMSHKITIQDYEMTYMLLIGSVKQAGKQDDIGDRI